MYPAPPVSAETLEARIGAYTHQAADAAKEAQATEHAIDTKNEALQALADDMKMVLRYAENVTRFDDASLKVLGWGGHKAKTSLESPG